MARDDDGLHLETLAVHAGREPDPVTGAVVPALVRSTTFLRDAAGELVSGHNYARDANPNRDAVESAMARLEGGVSALAFASGNAASSAVLSLAAGGHIVLALDSYHGTRRIVTELGPDLGIEHSAVDACSVDAIADAIQEDTRLVWVETPSNPNMDICDIQGVAALSRGAGWKLVCDNTFATPVLQNPLRLGADLVIHSATKYLGGHSDLMGGLVIHAGDPELEEALRRQQTLAGGVLSPEDAWLLSRSLTTLPLRVDRASATAAELARRLVEHPRVAEVLYPGLPSHPGHDTARRQMRAFGAMLSFRVHGGRSAAMAVLGGAGLFLRATSLGGVESLIEHRATSEGPGTRAPEDLIRLSVGIEHPEDLWKDLADSLDRSQP